MFSAARHTALRQARSSCLQRSRVTAPLSRDAALARLLSTLAVLEQREGKLNMSSLAAVSAAMKLGGEVTGFVAGSNTKAVAEDAAKVEGLDKVIYVDNADYDKVCKPTFARLLQHPLTHVPRVCPRTSPPYSSKTSKREASPTS
jgi:electron transfer flavoprotein alpha subunit